MSRTLSDDDIDAITDALHAKIVNDFYGNVGKGMWAVVWKVIMGAMIGLAAYGAYTGGSVLK